MKNKFQLAIIILLIVAACSKSQLIAITPNSDSTSSGKSFSTNRSSQIFIVNVPDCILKKINDAYTANVNSGGIGRFTITEYLFQGKKVYLISSGIPDSGSSIYDENCNNICNLGGFIINPNQLCNGEVFTDKAVKLRDIFTH